MAGGECHMMIGLCEVNLGACHEGESSELMPELTLGQGVEQDFQRVIRNSTNDKIGILSHEGNGHGNPTWRHVHAKKSVERRASSHNHRLGHAWRRTSIALKALPTLLSSLGGVLSVRTPRFLDISRHFTVHLFRPWMPNSRRCQHFLTELGPFPAA